MKYSELLQVIDAASQQLRGRAAAAVNQALVMRNWLAGAYLVEFEQRGEDRAKYGLRLIERLADDLAQRGVKGMSPTYLRLYRELYLAYPQIGQMFQDRPSQIQQTPSVESALVRTLPPIQQTLSGKSGSGLHPCDAAVLLHLSWSHLVELLRLDDPLKRAFYENESLKGLWSVRQLQRQIGSLLYERTGLSKDKKAVVRRAHRQEKPTSLADLIRDPYVLEFAGLAELPAYSENQLETALLDHLQSFLLELGTGFCFEARQKRITVGNEHDYIDLVFYHRLLRCHVLIDLKVRPFRHGDAGQMNFYLNYYKERVRAEGDQPPVGILLCSDKDKTKVEFATAGIGNKVFVSRYLVALPSADQLRAFIEKDRAAVEALFQTKH